MEGWLDAVDARLFVNLRGDRLRRPVTERKFNLKSLMVSMDGWGI